MEGKEEVLVGVTVKGDEAPESYRVAPRTESPRQLDGAPPPAGVPALGSSEVKKKRGRPRKYGPDGVALSPMPISSSIPLWQRNKEKIKKKHKFQFGSSGDKLAFLVGGNFTPHVITVNPGEDITIKVMSFSQQGSRAICVLSANGPISNVTLRSPTSCGGTLTYEGRFEILSLSGSFTPTGSAETVSRSGGMSISLAGPDGRVLGGGLGGLLIAAGPVQVVVGSFMSGHQPERKPKKQRAVSRPSTPNVTAREVGRPCGGLEPNVPPAANFNGDNSARVQDLGIPITDNNLSFSEEESNGLS